MLDTPERANSPGRLAGLGAAGLWLGRGRARRSVASLLQAAGWRFGPASVRASVGVGRAPASDPLVLLRVDDYPHWRFDTAQFWEFHERLQRVGLPYLLAATPFLASEPLASDSPPRPPKPGEWTQLAGAVERCELEVGLQGITHRTRSGYAGSEFDGLSPLAAREGIREAWEFLERAACRPVAFVPPFNRFPPELWESLPAACRVLCLGPESLRDVPVLPSLSERAGRRVVLSLPPFYGHARDIVRALERGRWLERRGVVIPITLHWTWEIEDRFQAVDRLAALVRNFVGPWRAV